MIKNGDEDRCRNTGHVSLDSRRSKWPKRSNKAFKDKYIRSNNS